MHTTLSDFCDSDEQPDNIHPDRDHDPDDVDLMTTYLEGVGPKTAERLNRQFGGFEGVLTATRQQLQRTQGVGRKTAKRIYYPMTSALARRVVDRLPAAVSDGYEHPIAVVAARVPGSNVPEDASSECTYPYAQEEPSLPDVWTVEDSGPSPPPEWATAVIETERGVSVRSYDHDADAVIGDDGRYVPVDGPLPDHVPSHSVRAYGVAEKPEKTSPMWQRVLYPTDHGKSFSFYGSGMTNSMSLPASRGPHNYGIRRWYVVRYESYEGYYDPEDEEYGPDSNEQENNERDESGYRIRLG